MPIGSSDLLDNEYFKQRISTRLGLFLGSLVILGQVSRHILVPLPPLAMLNFFWAAVFLSIPIMIRKGLSGKYAGYILVTACAGVALISGITNGGMRAPATVLLVISPIVAFFSINKKGALYTFTLSLLTGGFLLFGERLNWFSQYTPGDLYSFNIAIIYSVAAGACYLLGSAYEDSRIESEKRIRLLTTQSARVEKLAAFGEMSGGLAHEINNPLAIIYGTAGLLSKNSGDPEKLASQIAKIEKSCDRISLVVKSLQMFSQTDGQNILKKQELCPIAVDAISLTESKSKIHAIPITLECKTNSHVLCNEAEIQKVFINLISNAIDAVKGMPAPWIKVAIFDKDDSVVLRVTDSGDGIPPEVDKKLFLPFFTTKNQGEGMGLGLSVTKGILDDHNASIAVVSNSPNTCFEIKFPRAS
jgi:signal transduction histidine kinase